ncbi:MAG: hypothetical protein AAFP90_14640 [Planctomycetota bacterium]
MFEQIENWRKLPIAELHAAVIAPGETMRPVDERTWSIAGIARVYDAQIAEAIYAGIESAGLRGLAARFATAGIDATDPQWLAMADQLIAANPALAAVGESIKWIGYDRSPVWQRAGLPTEPTIDEVQNLRQENLDSQRLTNAKALFAERMTVDGDASAVWLKAWTDAEA